MFTFLFTTWLGGVICSLIALLIAGPFILMWINKGKAAIKAEANHLREKLHHANQNAQNQNSQNQSNR